MDRGKEKGGMDYVRMAAACMVVAIHTYPFTSFLEVLKSLFVLTGKVRFNPDDCGLPLCQEAERISRNNQGSHKDGYRNAQAGRIVWAFGRNQGNDGIFPPGHTGNLYPSVCQ